MNRSDWLLVALNSLMMAFAFIGFASVDEEMLIVAAMLTMAVAVVNLGALYRRRNRVSPPRDRARDTPEVDEMDVHTVLDIDARLEALERAQHDAVDAARWRALVESGQVSGPTAAVPPTHAGTSRPPVSNGRGA